MSSKPGRNDPCWCGSGKKYKHCHLRQDNEAKRAARVQPPAAQPARPPTRASTSPEQAAADAEWDQFEQADLEGKIALFLERVDGKRPDADDAVEMLAGIRDELDPRHDAKARARFAGWVERVRRDLPDAYRQRMGFYLSDLVDDAVADQRWDTLPGLLADFADTADRHIDAFSHIVEVLLYHGQTQTLYSVMSSAWPGIASSGDLFDWAVDEFGGTLMSLVLFHYLEATTTPCADDPALVGALSAYGQPRMEWLNRAVRHLSAPSAWRAEDFGEAVDAEKWQDNVEAILYEFMADQRRSANVPLSRSELAHEELLQVLLQQFSEGPVQPGGKARGKKPRRTGALRVPVSSLVPRRQVLDRTLAEGFDILGGHPYRSGALIELVPAYLHFLARLGLIHPDEMDLALTDLHSLGVQVSQILDRWGADIYMVHAVEAAWSDAKLEAWRHDPALDRARAQPPTSPPAPAITARPQTCTFKVTYRQQPDAWFVIEMRGDQTLHDLHRTILDGADFDQDHLYSFYRSGRAWDKATEYRLGRDAQHSSRTRIGDLSLRMKQRLLYLYDFGDEHHFDVQLVATSAEPPHGGYPRIVEQHGKMPPQYPDWEEEGEDWDEEESWQDQEWDEDLDEEE